MQRNLAYDGPRTSPWILFEYLGTFAFLVLGWYCAYLQIFYVLPYYYSDDPFWYNLHRFIALFLLFQIMTNWYLVRRYNAIYTLDEGVPEFIREFQRQCVNPRSVKRHPLMWRYCPPCKKWAPPRSHHCKICDRCILKRDHHCYFTSTCVGYSNQRFFIVMIFYWIFCVAYMPMVWRYLNNALGYQFGWSDCFLPITVWRTMFGTLPAQGCVIMTLFWGSPLIWLLAPTLLYDQLKELYTGLTPYEVERGVRLTPKAPRSALFEEIFGKYWWLNFIFPVFFLYPSECDGKNWKNHRVLEDDELTVINAHGHGHGHSHGYHQHHQCQQSNAKTD